MLALLLSALLLAPAAAPDSAASRQRSAPPAVDRLPSWNLSRPAATRGQLWFDIGFAIIDDRFDEAGTREAFSQGFQRPIQNPAGGEPLLVDGVLVGQYNVINAHLGGSYDVLQRPAWTAALGFDVGFSQQHFLAREATLFLPPALGGPQTAPVNTKIQSRLNPQNLTLFGEARYRFLSAQAGSLLDLAPTPDRQQQELSLTDGQDALLLGLTLNESRGGLLLFGGAAAYLTFEGREAGATYDEGDLFTVYGGAGYRFSLLEVGCALTYRHRAEGTEIVAVPGASGVATRETLPARHVGIAPYVHVSPPDSRLVLFLKFAVQDEYRDYSLSISGKEDIAADAGATFGFYYPF